MQLNEHHDMYPSVQIKYSLTTFMVRKKSLERERRGIYKAYNDYDAYLVFFIYYYNN